MWEIDLKNQIMTFLYSLPIGFLFGCAFYLSEGLGAVSKKRRARLWISDLLFFSLAGFLTYCFLLARTNGEIRGYVIFGELLGFYLFKRLFSKPLVFIVSAIGQFVADIISRLSNGVRGLCYTISTNLRKFIKKVKIFGKKGLKNQE